MHSMKLAFTFIKWQNLWKFSMCCLFSCFLKKIPSLDRCGRDKIQTFLINKEILEYFLSIVLISCFYELSISRQMGTRQNSDMGKICLLFVLISDRFKNWLCLFMVPLKEIFLMHDYEEILMHNLNIIKFNLCFLFFLMKITMSTEISYFW